MTGPPSTRRRWPGSRLAPGISASSGSAASLKLRSSGGGAAIARAAAATIASPQTPCQRNAPASGSVGRTGRRASARIRVPNKPGTRLRGPTADARKDGGGGKGGEGGGERGGG